VTFNNEPGATPISISFHLDETKYQAAWVWETKEKVSHVTASYVTASWVWGRREKVSRVTVSWVWKEREKGVTCNGFLGLEGEGKRCHM